MTNTNTSGRTPARVGVPLQTVAAVLIFGAAMAPLLVIYMLGGISEGSDGLICLIIGTAMSAALSYAASRLLTWKLERAAKLMLNLARPQSVENMLKIERELISLGGAKELRSSSAAIRKVVYALVRSSKAARAKQ